MSQREGLQDFAMSVQDFWWKICNYGYDFFFWTGRLSWSLDPEHGTLEDLPLYLFLFFPTNLNLRCLALGIGEMEGGRRYLRWLDDIQSIKYLLRLKCCSKELCLIHEFKTQLLRWISSKWGSPPETCCGVWGLRAEVALVVRLFPEKNWHQCACDRPPNTKYMFPNTKNRF